MARNIYSFFVIWNYSSLGIGWMVLIRIIQKFTIDSERPKHWSSQHMYVLSVLYCWVRCTFMNKMYTAYSDACKRRFERIIVHQIVIMSLWCSTHTVTHTYNTHKRWHSDKHNMVSVDRFTCTDQETSIEPHTQAGTCLTLLGLNSVTCWYGTTGCLCSYPPPVQTLVASANTDREATVCILWC